MASMPLEARGALLEDVLERYSGGEQIGDIAPELGMHEVTLYRYLLADRQEEFRQAQVSRAMSQFETAAAHRDACGQAIKDAKDQLELNRHTQLMKLAQDQEKRSQWLMERCLSKIYGQDKGQTQAPVAIQINLRRDDL